MQNTWFRTEFASPISEFNSRESNIATNLGVFSAPWHALCTLKWDFRGFSADFYAEVQDLVYGWLSLIIHSILRAKHVFVRTRFRHEIEEITTNLYLISAIKWVSSLFLFNYFSFEDLAIYVNINFSIFYEDWNFGMYSHCQTYSN